MTTLLELLLAGLANGAIYASLALAIAIVYQATGHINFAQGEMSTLATFLAWALLGLGWSYWAAFGATLALAFMAGVLLQHLLLARLRDAGAFALIVLFLGLYLICRGLTGWLWGHTVKVFPSPFPDRWSVGLLSAHQTGVIAVTLLTLVLLQAFLRLTPAGLALRAAAQQPESAQLVGIRVGRVVALAWGAACALGALAGMLIAPVLFLHPQMMSGVLIYAFAGAVAGGLQNPLGAVLGGVLVGVVEALAGAYLPYGGNLKLSLALLLIVVVLYCRPGGLVGDDRPVRLR